MTTLKSIYARLRWLAITTDLTLLSASYFGAAFAVLGRLGFPDAISEIVQGYPLLVGLTLVAFALRGVYRTVIRYTSIDTYFRIGQAVLIATAVATYPFFAFDLSIPIPWRLLPVYAAFGFGTTSMIRALFTVWQARPRAGSGVRVLIYGAGAGGALAARELFQNPSRRASVRGFIDDDERKQGRNILGLQVLGAGADLPEIVSERRIEEVIVAIPSATGTQMREILRKCRAVQRRVDGRRVPLITSTQAASVARTDGSEQLERGEIPMARLLRRAPRDLDFARIRSVCEGKRVLITGAGGSIGSEIARTVASASPRRLVLLDMSEESLHAVGLDVADIAGWTDLRLVLGDVSERPELDRIFEDERPEVVIHGAAYKHVRLVEENPCEAILNNVRGTMNIAAAANTAGAGILVNISTDKAVRPTSLMGATKRLSEVYLQLMDERSATRMMSVRFGNVLGSSGSLVPVINSQIRAGGPVTITDPDATRYFMLISEAAQLTLHAASVGRGGEIFVLDMGDPLRIQELVELLIYLHGQEAGEDIRFEYIGLGQGEKLHEELWHGRAVSVPDLVSITLDNYRPDVTFEQLDADAKDLLAASTNGTTEDAQRRMWELVGNLAPTAIDRSGAARTA